MASLPLLAMIFAARGDEPAWNLVWSDEFDSGTRPDSKKWAYDVGATGWGNRELQNYTASTDNVRIENGRLILEARSEKVTGSDGVLRDYYTSGRIKTQGKASWTYGRIEARIKIPRGQGIWPAFWALGSNFGSVGWPACGEIDIMENIGREPNLIHGVIHGPGYSGGKGIDRSYSLPAGRAFADDFHLFAIEWEADRIQWFVNGQRFATLGTNSIPKGSPWVFNKPFFLLLNVAVGGDWPGPPNATTRFPQRMEVDYVRVYSRVTAPMPRVRLDVFPDRVEARWPIAFPHALLDRSAEPNAPWIPVKTDGRRINDEFVTEVSPGLYRLRWTR